MQPAFMSSCTHYLLPAFVSAAFRFYIVQRHFPSTSNLFKVRDDAFSIFWTKLTGETLPTMRAIVPV